MKKYLDEHQLDDLTRGKWGLKVADDTLIIPIKDVKGKVAFNKYRHLAGDAKYSYDKGSSMELFGAYLMTYSTLDVWIVEGELKAIALNEIIGSSENTSPRKTVVVSSTGGASSFKDEWYELLHERNVHILYDNDKAGNEGAMRLWARLQKVKGIYSVDVRVLPEGYKDVNEYLEENGRFECVEAVPANISLFGTNTGSTRNNRKAFRKFFSDLSSYEFRVYTEQHRWFVAQMRDIARNEFRSQFADKPKIPEGFAESLEEVKRIPIDSILKFVGGWAPCVFHSDSNPSMYYNGPNSAYPNTVKCYSCGRFADVIDVVQAINNVDFKGALEILKGKK